MRLPQKSILNFFWLIYLQLLQLRKGSKHLPCPDRRMIKIDCDLEIFSAVRDGFHGSVTKTHVMDAVTFGVIQRLRFFYGERLSEGRRVLRRRRSPEAYGFL